MSCVYLYSLNLYCRHIGDISAGGATRNSSHNSPEANRANKRPAVMLWDNVQICADFRAFVDETHAPIGDVATSNMIALCDLLSVVSLDMHSILDMLLEIGQCSDVSKVGATGKNQHIISTAPDRSLANPDQAQLYDMLRTGSLNADVDRNHQLVSMLPSIVVNQLFAPVAVVSNMLSPGLTLESDHATCFEVKKGVSFEGWVMMLSNFLCFLSGFSISPPGDGDTGVGTVQHGVRSSNGRDGIIASSMSGKPISYEVKTFYGILVCSLDINNKYRSGNNGRVVASSKQANEETSHIGTVPSSPASFLFCTATQA